MFFKQFRCSIIIDGKTFEGVVDVCKVKGSEYMNLYSIQGEFPVLYTNVKIIGKKLSKKFCAHGTLFPHPRGLALFLKKQGGAIIGDNMVLRSQEFSWGSCSLNYMCVQGIFVWAFVCVALNVIESNIYHIPSKYSTPSNYSTPSFWHQETYYHILKFYILPT